MTNEAAERLMIHLGSWKATKLREALAAERKATVERIRAAWDAENPLIRHPLESVLFAILDAELSASPETDSQAER